MIIGRKSEIEILNNSLLDDSSHFIAIYGRRRIGKTFLVRESFKGRFTFQHAGLSEGSLSDQIFAFCSSIKDAGGDCPRTPKNWLEAFEYLKEIVRNSSEKKKVIFIDELSWMDTKNSDLIVALEHFWNGWASARNDVILIVCASASSWILSKVIHNKGGLYNRITEQIHLDTFSLAECEEYIIKNGLALNRLQIMQYYMIFGGVPYYWGFLKKGQSLVQNIDRILFEKDAPLKDEFKYLYSSIFRNPTVYIKIIEALGTKKVGMTREEVIEKSGIANSGDLSTKLEELESCGFIRKYNSFGKKKKNTIYQLIDNFTLFHYIFLRNGTTDEHFWSNQLNTPKVNTWMGLAFERVCLRHEEQIKYKLGISGIQTETRAWYCKADKDKGVHGSQVDLLIERKDRVINLCEMKYSNSHYTFTKEDDEKMRRRINDIQLVTETKYAIFPTLITTFGLVDNSYSGDIQSLITMDDLFSNI